MNPLQKLCIELSCRIYAIVIRMHGDSLQFRYSEEMSLVFRESITEASHRGFLAMVRVWATVAAETISLLGPAWSEKAGVLAASIAGSTALVLITAMGFCTMGPLTIVHGYSVTPLDEPAIPGHKDRLVTLPGGHNVFLSCWEPREIHKINTVILATGRGIGDHTGWTPVQSAVSQFARVCSYDPLGAGKSDPQPAAKSISQLVDQMHSLFRAADLPQPYILVGTSLGGVLARSYETRFPNEVGGFVFADSSHEEMAWRDAAIAPDFAPGWDDPKALSDNDLLAKGQISPWHDDVPTIVLERSERAPCEAFPNLTHPQCEAINDAWHSFQVDLSHRSKYAQLRIVQGAGHRMVMQKPEVVAQAVHEVINQMN
jgi:pimeloyl-ACP methyl ester carboxylesterase